MLYLKSVGENRNEEIKNKRDQKSGAGRIESKRKFSYSFMFAAGRRAYTGCRYGLIVLAFRSWFTLIAAAFLISA